MGLVPPPVHTGREFGERNSPRQAADPSISYTQRARLEVHVSSRTCWCDEFARLLVLALLPQAHDINALFGFRLECLERLGEEFVFVWRRINELFNYLPLAASIESKILCMHGGIGRSITTVRKGPPMLHPWTKALPVLRMIGTCSCDPPLHQSRSAAPSC